jgi:hypothetical protein
MLGNVPSANLQTAFQAGVWRGCEWELGEG